MTSRYVLLSYWWLIHHTINIWHFSVKYPQKMLTKHYIECFLIPLGLPSWLINLFICSLDSDLNVWDHSVHWVINPLPQKHYSPLAKPSFQSAKCPSPPPALFREFPPLYCFFVTPAPRPLLPVKIWFFCEPQRFSSFSSLTPSYLSKITKFLVNVSQFEFFVKREKNFC